MKPGIRTSEFWLSLAVAVGAVVADIGNVLPDRYAAIAATVSAGLYALSRGWAKSGNGGGGS